MRVWGAESAGTSQLVIDKRRRIVVGATFTGSEVQDMLEAATFAVVGELALERLRHGVAPFPTRSEVWLNLLEPPAYSASATGQQRLSQAPAPNRHVRECPFPDVSRIDKPAWVEHVWLAGADSRDMFRAVTRTNAGQAVALASVAKNTVSDLAMSAWHRGDDARTREAASACIAPSIKLALDDDQERRRRLLLLGKGAVLAHRLARPLAAELDDKQQRAT